MTRITMATLDDNPYESPNANRDEARYDRSLFWRITKCLLRIVAVLLVIDLCLSGYMQWSRTTGGQQIGDTIGAVKDFSWDQVQEALQKFQG